MIYDWARSQAEITPDAVALTLEDSRLTYGELESQSNRLAGVLLEIGIRPLDRIGMLLQKRPDTVTAMLGINKAGGVYVPLDINSPADRLAKIIESADPTVLMIDREAWPTYLELIDRQPEIRTIPWIWWEDSTPEGRDKSWYILSRNELDTVSDYPHQVLRDSRKPAHILFTSGSTGQPKGVVIKHENVEAFIDWAVPHFDIRQGDRVSGHAPLHFDLSTFDIYGSLAAGAHLFMVPTHITVMPNNLVTFISDNQLDQWFSVPSVLSYMARFEVIPEQGFPHLKRLIWCGEVFPVPALQYWMKQLPGVQFTNLYGPTEATIASSYYTLPAIPESDQEIPIGSACEGEELLVLDESLQKVPKGEIGDLYITGKGLSPGYWRDKEKTEQAFYNWTNDFGEAQRIYKTGDLASVGDDGLIYFHGRADYQIKSRGYRIELGEIESALSTIKLLREFAVVPVEKGGFEGTSIGCAYVGNGNSEEVSPAFLKKILAQKIPQYMMPQYWSMHKKLPRNGNGKIDRKALSLHFENNERKFIKAADNPL